MAHGMAEELSREDREFLKERAPRLLQVIKEAEERSFDEVLKEAIERVSDLQEEWEEAREDGEKWAGLMVGEMANEAALDYLVWKFEEGEIEEGQAEETLRDLMEERWRIDNGITEREMKMAAGNGDADLAAEVRERAALRRALLGQRDGELGFGDGDGRRRREERPPRLPEGDGRPRAPRERATAATEARRPLAR